MMTKTYADWNTFSDADRAEDDAINAARRGAASPRWPLYSRVRSMSFWKVLGVAAAIGAGACWGISHNSTIERAILADGPVAHGWACTNASSSMASPHHWRCFYSERLAPGTRQPAGGPTDQRWGCSRDDRSQDDWICFR